MKNLSAKLFVALTLTAAAGASFAAETSAQFDPKKCSIEYPKASLMNEEQGTTTASFLVTADGMVNLSAALPRSPDDVEAWMARLRG